MGLDNLFEHINQTLASINSSDIVDHPIYHRGHLSRPTIALCHFENHGFSGDVDTILSYAYVSP